MTSAIAGAIIRVFPRRTSLTPTDDMVFIGEPPLEGFRPPANEVHVSCCFTWDKPKAEYLQKAWGQYYPVVKLGGPAFDSPINGFTPGQYVRTGVTFTSRGCNNHCDFCLVPEREGRLQVYEDFAAGEIINDNNLLQTGKPHIEKVFEMLKHQNAASFAGGIEADLVSDWFSDQLKTITVKNLFLACDTDEDIPDLKKAVSKLAWLGRDKLYCYVLIGRETLERATERLEAVWESGCFPFAQLYQPPEQWIKYSQEWRDLARAWSRPAIMKAMHG
jgi:hypothetical protein